MVSTFQLTRSTRLILAHPSEPNLERSNSLKLYVEKEFKLVW